MGVGILTRDGRSGVASLAYKLAFEPEEDGKDGKY
jgi:hypothetical protein